MADNKDEIEFTLKGLAAVLKGYKAVQDAAKETDKATGLTGGAGGGPSRPSVPRPVPSQPSPKMPSYTSGPNQRYAKLKREMQSALKDGNVLAEKDIKLAIDRTEKQLNRLKKPAFSKKLETFIRSTRFGAAGVQPLVGATADLLGEAGEAAGPIGLFVAAVTEAGKALRDFADQGAQTTAGFSRLGYSTGATPGQTAKLNQIGNALGFTGDQTAALANNVGQAASGGGLPSALASQLGIDIRPFPYGSTDNADKLLKLIKGVRNAPSDKQAKILADSFGADDLLSIRNLKPADYQNVLKQASATPGAFGKEQVENAAGLIASEGNLKTSIDKLDATIGDKLAPFFTNLNNYGAKEADKVTNTLTKSGGLATLEKIGKSAINNLFPGMIESDPAAPGAAVTAAGMKASENKDAKESQDKHTAALNRHAAALDKNSREFGRAPGSYGNVTRGNALPEAATGLSLHKALADKEMYQLGSF